MACIPYEAPGRHHHDDGEEAASCRGHPVQMDRLDPEARPRSAPPRTRARPRVHAELARVQLKRAERGDAGHPQRGRTGPESTDLRDQQEQARDDDEPAADPEERRDGPGQDPDECHHPRAREIVALVEVRRLGGDVSGESKPQARRPASPPRRVLQRPLRQPLGHDEPELGPQQRATDQRSTPHRNALSSWSSSTAVEASAVAATRHRLVATARRSGSSNP